ncbi:MAG: NUDIX domain-containing protein [Gemmatimonadales bacterium]
MTDWAEVPVFGSPPTAMSGTIRPSAYGIVSDREGRIAVVHTPSGLTLPGGGCDDAEMPEATVARETREECGLAVRVGRWRRAAIEHVYSTVERAQFEKRSVFCDAAVVGEAGAPSEADHVLEWMSADEATTRLEPASHRWAVGEWLGAAAPTVIPGGTPCVGPG